MSKSKTILLMDASGDRIRKFPELGGLDDEWLRTKAINCAKAAVSRKHRLPIIARMSFVLTCIVFVLVANATGLEFPHLTILVLIAGPICLGLEFWLYAWRIRRIRAEVATWIDRRELFCRYCDYSLRGNTSGRCPECGEAISADQRRLISQGNALGLEIDPGVGVE